MRQLQARLNLSMKKIKNIIFDLGGVLLTEDDNWVNSEEVKNILVTDNELLDKGWEMAWPDGRDGKTNEDEFFQTFLNTVIGRIDENTIVSLKKIYRDKADTFTAFPILKSLKNKYKIFAVPNITKDWLEYKTQKFYLNDYIDLIVSSCGEGIAKPNKEIFLSLINKTGIDPSETYFIDNMERNIIAARELHFQTHLYKDIKNLKQDMSKLKINYEQI